MSAIRSHKDNLTIPQGSAGRFTQVYLTANNHYGIVLYGVVLGFVVYVILELAAGLWAAGTLVPTSATLAAALVAIFVGLRVPFRQPGGRVS